MDPDQALDDVRYALTRLDEDGDAVDMSVLRDAINAFQSLDDWLTGGGFLPADWARGR